VGVGLIAKFSAPFWVVTGAALVLQAVTIWLVLTLNARHFRPERTAGVATPAE
jgi:hypothetical protein